MKRKTLDKSIIQSDSAKILSGILLYRYKDQQMAVSTFIFTNEDSTVKIYLVKRKLRKFIHEYINLAYLLLIISDTDDKAYVKGKW